MASLIFSVAVKLVPNRRDKILTRINIFNYGGAILGTTMVGLLSIPIPIGHGATFDKLGIELLSTLCF
ncbi:hypothetical protein ACK2M2_02080 [Acinetobacter sp. TY1]|uniref:hypothetical protein n=1 Tax=Acinetobacter sp. TY1 TaxID=3387626 RepID=UPI003AF8A5CE